jgi:dipeptide/tripeptide permease
VLGLFLIGVGTGGIKPCVSAFGGDQFRADQQHLIQGFFAAFYFSINAGSFLATIIMPKLRADVQCYGDDECYPLAFGVPAILMALATLIFFFGRKHYRHTIPDRNIMVDAAKAIWIGVKGKCSRQAHSYEHWLDPAIKRFDESFIRDIRTVLGVFVLFIPTPLFWTLFDQQGSRWTLQAEQMQTFDMGALGRFRPDMMQALNAGLILVMIPVFERFIYPFLRKVGFRMTPLQRMTSGMVLCALSFALSGLIQIRIDNAMPVTHPGSSAQLRLINARDGMVMVTTPVFNTSLGPGESSAYFTVQNTTSPYAVMAVANATSWSTTLPLSPDTRYTMVFSQAANGANFTSLLLQDDAAREEGTSPDEIRVRVANAFDNARMEVTGPEDVLLTLSPLNASYYNEAIFLGGKLDFTFQLVDPATNASLGNSSQLVINAADGADYTIVYGPDVTSDQAEFRPFIDVQGNSISILWQVPQYFVITCGEVLFSITGLELAFAEAPATMKAVVQAGWLLTTTVGSLIVIIVAEASFFDQQRDEFFFFAGCMLAVTVVFAWLASGYRYRNPRYVSMAYGDVASQDTPLLEDSPSDSLADTSIA